MAEYDELVKRVSSADGYFRIGAARSSETRPGGISHHLRGTTPKRYHDQSGK